MSTSSNNLSAQKNALFGTAAMPAAGGAAKSSTPKSPTSTSSSTYKAPTQKSSLTETQKAQKLSEAKEYQKKAEKNLQTGVDFSLVHI